MQQTLIWPQKYSSFFHFLHNIEKAKTIVTRVIVLLLFKKEINYPDTILCLVSEL